MPGFVSAVDNAKRWTLSPGARTGVLVYRFEIAGGRCSDDGRSLFQRATPELVVITACTASHRVTHPSVVAPDVKFVSYGDRPGYPVLAQSARLAGVVVLEVGVDGRGNVVESRPLTNLLFLTEAALAHSRTRRTRPAAAARRAFVVYEFALDNPACDSQRQTAFREVTANYMKLSGCGPLIDF